MRNRDIRRGTVVVLLSVLWMFGSVCGCGGSNRPTASVSGKVTWNGNPVTAGELLFDPQSGGDYPGKSGAGAIRADGTYSVSTYRQNDGAVLGEHRVSYAAPPPTFQKGAPAASSGDRSTEGDPVASPFRGLRPKNATVTVSRGVNTIDIELVRP